VSRRIAFFDFDGTITTRDTLLEFIRYSRGTTRFWLGFAINSPWLLAYKLKMIGNQAAKERILRFFFGGRPLEDFQRDCDHFTRELLPSLIRSKALTEIERLQQTGATVVIVSASPEHWIRAWAESRDIQLLATRLGVRKDRLTGRIEGKNCHGAEKVRRIREAYTLADYTEVYAYGDTGGDKPMLALGTHSFYKPFR
jgi:phosphatidylglycerophosphatase C